MKNKRRLLSSIRLALFCALAGTLAHGSVALANTLLVSNNNDSGPGSLRQAIADNHLLGGDNSIIFSNVVIGVITLSSGELLVTNDARILGPGPKVLTVHGNNAGRVFHFMSANANLSGLTIANGSNSLGGGILQESGVLVVSNCVVTKNKALNGGGLAQTGGNLTIYDTTISTNNAGNTGVGLYLQNSFTSLRRCTFVGNVGSGFSTSGGGITHNGQNLNAENCTFFGNGGTGGNGGGELNNSGNATFTSCTFYGNYSFQGGGIAVMGGTVMLRNNILAGNNSLTGAAAAPDCYGTVISTGYNLVGNRTNSYGWGASGDQLGTTASPINPLLTPLQDNGGATWTMRPQNNSPAIDKGHSNGTTTDQHGGPRPIDKPIANAAGGDGADIGAFETGTRTITVLNLNYSGTGSLYQAVLDAAADEVTTIRFAAGLSGSIHCNDLYVSKNLIVEGPGPSVLTLSGNGGNRVVSAMSGNISISGLTIRDGVQLAEDGGQEDPDAQDSLGGGVFVSGQAILSLTDCHILFNRAQGGNGGSPTSGNGGKGGHAFGGGIANIGTVNLTRCVVEANSVIPGAGGPSSGEGIPGTDGNGYGGGLYSSGPANITNCTFYGNSTQRIFPSDRENAGGGIYTLDTLNLINCTLTGNILSGSGGPGAALYDNVSSSVIRHCTISGNDSGIYFSGGNIGNTIVAGNSGGDLVGSMVSSDYNLFGSMNGVSITGPITHTLIGQDPLLGPLTDHGGPTPTMALLPGSPAIDRGASLGTPTDQRGRPRPFDIAGVANVADASDIGAYELIIPKLSLSRQGTNAWLSWSTADPSYWLESTTNIGMSGAWTPVTTSPSNLGTQFIVVEPLISRKFYRLRNQ